MPRLYLRSSGRTGLSLLVLWVGLLACSTSSGTKGEPNVAAGSGGASAATAGVHASAGHAAVSGSDGTAPTSAGGVAATDAGGSSGMPADAGAVGAAGISGSGGAPTAGAAAPSDASIAGASAADGGTAGAASPVDAAPAAFVLRPVGFPMAGDELTFPESANPPANESPEFEWAGVPPGAKSLALVFRDLGNGAVKWILWDIPPTLTRVPPNISKTPMPAELPGSRQMGSLDNQGYAGPGSGARQYDFKLWALDVATLPIQARQTTVEIHDDVLPMHDLATTEPILVRNTRNLR